MSIIELGNGKVLKDGVVFDEDARKYCTEINKDENGKVISEKIIKSCTETETLNKQNFLVTWLTDERYQNSVIMVFMGILENL